MRSCDLVSLNIRVPEIASLDTLQVAAAGLNILMDGRKTLGLEFDDFSLRESAELTMGDHASDLCNGTDEDFDRIYKNAKNVVNTVLACQSNELEGFLSSLLGITDIMVFEYPGVIRFCVMEGTGDNGGSNRVYINKPNHLSGYSY